MKQLDKKSVWLFFFYYVFQYNFFILFLSFWVTGFFGLDFFLKDDFLDVAKIIPFVIVVSICATIAAFLWAKLSYHFYKYEVTELGFKKESGVIWKKYTTIPFSRIQNVDINRGILARLLGLSDLLIQTAGNSATFNRLGAAGFGAEGRLPGVSKGDAEALRDELVKLASRKSESGL